MPPQRHPSAPSQSAAASKLIRDIRTAHGFDNNQSAQDPAVLELRGKLERALERLSNDLYNKKTHFLLEFIQNADDNAYGNNVVPTLRLRIEDRLVVFECNERGFSDDNVKAICDIGASTKTREKNPRGFIGEKGIGFKSVFTVANRVYITSGPYSFYFDKTAPLGMITPALDNTYPPVRGWTAFHLHLAPSENGNDLSAQLRDVSPTLLLFLRKLRALSIAIPRVNIEVRRTDDVDRDMVSLERIQDGKTTVERYVLVKYLAQTPSEEPSREDVKESEIVLAFPVAKTREPVLENQNVHAFLPLRCYGFKFIIQADFITSASREDVLADKPWNQALRGSVIDAFLRAIERFQSDPTLRNVWFRYIPESISDSFFCYVEHKLLAELGEKRILRSTDGTYFPASQLLFLPLSYRDGLGTPLIPEAYLPRQLHYLSSDYNVHPTSQDRRILHRLGVREMTDEDFFEGLRLMDKAGLLCAQSDAWHDAVASLLIHLLPHGVIRTEVFRLRILPLHNGNWAPAGQASTFMFPPGVSIPDDLGLQSISPRIAKLSPRYQLFVRLGVMPPDPVTIAKKILTVMGPKSVAQRITHARFFFDHRMELNMPHPMRLRLADEQGGAGQGEELYLDLPGENDALSLRDALSSDARFLHTDYLTAYPEAIDGEETSEDGANNAHYGYGNTRSEWLDWLRDRVGLNVVPRVIDGHLSPDFLDRAPALEGRALLASLRVWWPRLAQRLTEAGARSLGTISITGRRLNTLYLPRGPLARLGEALELPCIPVDNPEDHAWDFLELLGVATRMNASFFVNKLVHMQAMGEKDNKLVDDIYKQLDARFDEDETLIKKAFREYPIILLSVNHETERVWLHKTDVYWYGPPSMRSKAIISRSYPHLSNFFFTKLGISQAPPFALVEELRMIAERYRSRPVPPEVQEHVAEILADICDVVQSMPKIPQSFTALAQIAVFPVQVPDEGIALCSAGDFYVPDRPSKYADVFRGRVPMLDLPDTVPMMRIRPLLDSDILKDKILYLDPHVTKRSVPIGRQVLNSAATDLYSSRVVYMGRLVLHNSKKSDIPPEQTKILTKLHKIKVINVPKITTTLTLGSCVETTSDDVTFEETDDKFTVYVSNARSQGKSIHPPVCNALSRLLEVDMLCLYTCVTQPVDIVEVIFELNGIAEIPVDDGHDRSWLQAMVQPSVPVVPPSAVPEQSPSPVLPPSPLPRPTTTLSVQEEPFPTLQAGAKPFKPFHHVPSLPSSTLLPPPPPPSVSSNGRRRQRSFAHSSVGVSEQSQFMQSPRFSLNSGASQVMGPPLNPVRDMNRPTAQMAPLINGNQMMLNSPAGPGWPPVNNFSVPIATEETDMVGILGEHYVYKLLVRTLDDFGPNNWTSELRHLVPGFAPFSGQAWADFTYLDSQGQLTRNWFGPEKAALWQGRWPTYHIEVKSTRGEETEPFHMSPPQMSTAFAFTERPQLGPDIYVIVRVMRLGTPEPTHRVYADPHRAFYLGRLLCASDVFLQRNALSPPDSY